jgi:hypothetical protein
VHQYTFPSQLCTYKTASAFLKANSATIITLHLKKGERLSAQSHSGDPDILLRKILTGAERKRLRGEKRQFMRQLVLDLSESRCVAASYSVLNYPRPNLGGKSIIEFFVAHSLASETNQQLILDTANGRIDWRIPSKEPK